MCATYRHTHTHSPICATRRTNTHAFKKRLIIITARVVRACNPATFLTHHEHKVLAHISYVQHTNNMRHVLLAGMGITYITGEQSRAYPCSLLCLRNGISGGTDVCWYMYMLLGDRAGGKRVLFWCIFLKHFETGGGVKCNVCVCLWDRSAGRTRRMPRFGFAKTWRIWRWRRCKYCHRMN